MNALLRSRIAVVVTVALACLVGATAIAFATGSSSGSAGDDTLKVTLGDGSISLDSDRIPAQSTYLEAFNEGSEEHELILFRTDTAADELPRGIEKVSFRLVDGELAVGADHESHNHSGEPEDRGPEPGETLTIRSNLEPGSYVVFCNIPGHYAAGEYHELEVVSAP